MIPTSPLDPVSFDVAVARGLGRCVLHLRAVDPEPYRDSLIATFRHHRAFDPQCEGTRTEYLFDLAEAAGMTETLRRTALEPLPTEQSRWDADQQVEILLTFTRDGDAGCAEAIRSGFDLATTGEKLFDAFAWGLLQLDGADGLPRLARRLRAEPPIHRRSIRWVVEDALGPEGVNEALVQMAGDPAVVSLLSTPLEPARVSQPRAPTVEELIASARGLGSPDGRSSMRPAACRLRASDEERARAATQLADTDDPWLQELLLRVFLYAPYPGPLDVLIRLAEGTTDGVALTAARVLARTGTPEVRALAWRQLGSSPPRWNGIVLLDANYLPGDGDALAAALEQAAELDDDALHSIGLHLFAAVCGEDRGPDVVAPLLWLYEHTPCSYCRRDAVEKLAQRGAVSRELAEECRWDACEETRALVRP